MTTVQVAAPVERRTPQIGDTVLIRHRVKTSKQGVAGLEVCKGVVGKIKTVMIDRKSVV